MELLKDPNALMVLLGTVLLSTGAAVVGNFTFLRKRALVGDTVAHAVLPGICIAFMLSGTKNPIWLMLGAVIAGWMGLLFMDLIIRKSKLKADTATGLVLSVFFGLGIFLLTTIQHSGNASQSGLDKFLFGNAASMMEQDVYVFGGTAIILLMIVALLFRPFKIVAFNPEYAASIGMPVWLYEFILSSLTVLAVASGIQAVGVVLMAALLITPAAAGRYWTDSLPKMMAISVLFAVLSAIGGTWVSFVFPSMPTGPWIIMFLSILAIVSVLVSPQQGVIARNRQRRKNEAKILRENALKAFYYLGNKNEDYRKARSFEEIRMDRGLSSSELKVALRRLVRESKLAKNGESWSLTEEGLKESFRIVRLHRLWELFLNKRLHLRADHVHDGAEAMEHVITPEIEALLEEELGNPRKDPHQSEIPYTS